MEEQMGGRGETPKNGIEKKEDSLEPYILERLPESLRMFRKLRLELLG